MLNIVTQLADCGRKFDHPPGGGTKDVAVAGAGAYLNAISSDEKVTLGNENLPSIYPNHNKPMDYEQKLDFNFFGGYSILSRPIPVFSTHHPPALLRPGTGSHGPCRPA